MSTTETTQPSTAATTDSTQTTTETNTDTTMSETETSNNNSSTDSPRKHAVVEGQRDLSGNNGGNFGLVQESDVFGEQFVQNNVNVENDELDARHAFVLKPEDANGGGRLIQLFSGIENSLEDSFYGYNIRQWQDKKQDGHEIPDGAESYYVAWRRASPDNVVTSTTQDNAFPDEMFRSKEYLTQTEDGDLRMNFSEELYSLESYIWETAETEADIMQALDAFEALADETPGTSDSLKEIVPPDNPDGEAELTQSTAAFFWSHLVGNEVLKCELTENGVYKPVEKVQYEWKDQTNKDAGVVRVE